MNICRFTLAITAVLLIGYVTGNAQANLPEKPDSCPPDKVCLSREAALKAIADGDTVKAQAVQIEALNKAISDYKDELNKMRIEFATVSGENTQLKQEQVRTNAIIDLLLKSVKRKCLPFSICIGN